MEKKIEFKSKTFHFDTGVSVSVNEDKIVAKDDGGNSNIDSKYFDNFSYQYYWESKISPAGLWFRFVGVSFILIFLVGLIFDNWTATPWVIFGIIIVVNIIFFLVFMLDAILELNLFRRIIQRFFSNHVYAVTIGNKSGNNIDFFALLNEESKLKDFLSSISKCN